MELNRALLLLLQKGDEEAFDAIFKQYAPRLYYFILSFYDNPAEAEDIVQETFVKIWENKHKIDENKNFNTFLFSIAKHIIYNKLKHLMIEKRYVDMVLQSPFRSFEIEDEMENKSLKDHLGLALSHLPPQQREILLLRNRGFDNNEIAKHLNISKRTVETHTSRAFRTLRIRLKE